MPAFSPFREFTREQGAKENWVGKQGMSKHFAPCGDLHFCGTSQAACLSRRETTKYAIWEKRCCCSGLQYLFRGEIKKVGKIGGRKADSDARPEPWPHCLPCCPTKCWSRLGNRWRGKQKQLLQEGFVKSILAKSHW